MRIAYGESLRTASIDSENAIIELDGSKRLLEDLTSKTPSK